MSPHMSADDSRLPVGCPPNTVGIAPHTTPQAQRGVTIYDTPPFSFTLFSETSTSNVHCS